MSAQFALAEGRIAAESLMLDTCELRSPDVQGEMDPDTGQYPMVPGPLLWAGKCKVRMAESVAHTADAGERLVVTAQLEVHVPMSAAQVAVDDLVTITTSRNDPQLTGRRFRIESQRHGTYLTARRLSVAEQQN